MTRVLAWPRFRGAAAAAIVLAACGMARSGPSVLAERELVVIPGTPVPPPADDPAQAAIERWLPHRADDPGLRDLVDAAMRSGRGRKVAGRALQTVGELGAVRSLIVEEGLPDLFLGIPYWESNFTDEAVSRSCAAGVWQLMPETAVEHGVKVERCRIGDAVWTPSRGVAASPASPYRGEQCGISTCEVDGRKDFASATRGAVDLLARMWRSPDVEGHPDRAGLVVIAYNTGLGALLQHVASAGADPLAPLPTCAEGGCATLSPQGAHYLPGVLAAAAMATCAAAEVPGTRFARDRDTPLCQAMRRDGLVATPYAAAGAAPEPRG